MTHLLRAPGDRRIKKWEHRRFRKVSDRIVRDAEKRKRSRVDARPHGCGGELYMQQVEHCWCLGRAGRGHWHLMCENCGAVGFAEHEHRVLVKRYIASLPLYDNIWGEDQSA